MSITKKLLLAFVLVSVLPILALGIYIYRIQNAAALEREAAELDAKARQVTAGIESRLQAQRHLSKHLSTDITVRRFFSLTAQGKEDVPAMNAWLLAHEKASKELEAVFLVDRSGVCLASSQPDFLGVSYAFRDYYQEGLAGRSYLSDWHLGLKRKGPCLFGESPVFEGTNVVGMVIVRFSTASIQEAIGALGNEFTDAFLINSMGIVLAHSSSNNIYHTTRPLAPEELEQIRRNRQFMNLELPPLSEESEALQVLRYTPKSTNRWVVKYSFNHHQKQAGLVRLSELPWLLGIAIDADVIRQQSRHILIHTFLFTSFAGLLALLASLILTRRLMRPAHDLAETIQKFTAGDMQARCVVSSSDELGEITKAFNHMAETIDAQNKKLNQRVQTLEGILPICAWCKKIRNDHGEYEPVETFISKRSEAVFSHGVCEACKQKLEAELESGD